MNGFQLYKQYITKAERSQRESADWRYGNLLSMAFYLVGVTRLFDMLEQAETTGCRIGLVYAQASESASPLPCGIELVSSENAANPFIHQAGPAQSLGFTHW
ncbi:hypothetical protein [uncultured Spirosoma sp.]|uniref:hypothetical protein n=1 Tax=uncultured Spirosoma sp. TaxID=278208 RepID=UPI002584CFEC|nr:hypothetical protein [uncultured Spirosoma sp.]